MKHVAVLGSGSWGTALAATTAQKAERVTLWGRDPRVIAEINKSHTNQRFIPDVALPDNITATADFRDLAGAELVVVVIPSRALRSVAGALRESGVLAPDAVILSATKGIENITGLRMSEILREQLPGHPVAVISGPNHAEEIARQLAAAAVIGAEDSEVSLELQQLFTLPWFRAYRSDDIVGIEWGGAVKNVFAIAAGISEGLGLGDNARAALVTRGLAEMARLGTAMGGRFESFQGLSGVGDLMVTCYSRHSRNNRVGNLLGRGKPLEDIIASMNMVAEGVPNTESIHHAARRCGVRTPIIDQVYGILYEGKPCASAMTELLSRDLRAENE